MILLDAIDFIIGFFTLRWLFKKGPEAVEAGLKQSYAESTEAKKMDVLAHAAEHSRKKEPIQLLRATGQDKSELSGGGETSGER